MGEGTEAVLATGKTERIEKAPRHAAGCIVRGSRYRRSSLVPWKRSLAEIVIARKYIGDMRNTMRESYTSEMDDRKRKISRSVGIALEAAGGSSKVESIF